MKKIVSMLLLLCVIFSVVPVSAETSDIWGKFKDTSTTIPVLCYPEVPSKNDYEQAWYIRLMSGPTAKNIFGARPTILSSPNNGKKGSSYYTWKTTFTSSKHYYYYDNLRLKMSDYVILNGKKDDSSTTTTTLEVTGKFTP